MMQIALDLPEYINVVNYFYAMILELVVASLSVLLVFGAARKFLQKRNKATVLIAFVFGGIFLAAFLTSLGKVLFVSGLLTYEQVVFVFYFDGLALMSVMISNTAFFVFTLDVFYDMNKKKKQTAISIYLILVAVAALGGIVTLITRSTEPIFKNLLTGMVVALSFFTYILLVYKAFTVASSTAGIVKTGMHLIGLSGLLIIAFFTTFALDVLNLFGWGNISLFYFIAWSVAGAAVIVTYIGYFKTSTAE